MSLPSTAPLRVAIVNDLAMAREALRRCIGSMPQTQVAWVAGDGAEAIAKAAQDRPDLILMDLLMPGVDGVEATRQIMHRCPCAIVVVTATVEGNATRVYEAIGAGALDAVETPRLAGECGARRNALAEKIEMVRRMRAGGDATATRPAPPRAGAPAAAAAPASAARPPSPIATAANTIASTWSEGGAPPIVAVGASTGGPQALSVFLSSLPHPFPAAVLIVQHMEPAFLPGMAAWLTAETRRPVRLARAGERPEPGAVLLAGEAQHLTVTHKGLLCYVDGPPELLHRPSVDMLFQSLAASSLEPGAGVLLTGMGKDGAAGLLQMRERGWATFAQDAATSVVWGMPGAAVHLGAAEQTLPLHALGAAVAGTINARRAGRAGRRA
ncbi:MAG: chemotaxis-specific protein-glutamate methyltransferase CheB [Phycisphaerales bacterium]